MRASRDVSPAVRAVVTVAATSIFMVLVAWATLLGPDQVFTGPGPSVGPSTAPTRTCIPAPTPDAEGNVVEPDNPKNLPICQEPDTSVQDGTDLVKQNPPPLWLKVIVWILLGSLLLGVTALVVWLLVEVVRQARARRELDGVRTALDFDVLDEAGLMADAIASDADEQDALLRTGEPRNAIVAAWHRFEVQGERAGVTRRPSETSSEYAIRVLDLVDADTRPVSALAALYREARFSDHAMSEDHRERALAALAAIRQSLGVRA